MTLTSFQFLAFVLVTFIVYYLFPQKHKWAVFLAASAVFYISFSPWGILFVTATSLIAFFSARQIQKLKDNEAAWMLENKRKVDKETRKSKKNEYKIKRNLWVVLTVAVSVGTLFMCKYYGSLADSVNNLFGNGFWTAENIILPLGISYYSLQLIGYVVDVSRDIIPAEKNPLKVTLFAMFFLSIMQGPFNRYNDLMPQLCEKERPKLSYQRIKLAVLKIAWGYVKKMCIADQVGRIAGEVFSNYQNYSGLAILLGILCFAIQLYADFSGYMDIILGIGELFGLRLPENFRQPFFSRSMSEFWKRWHITLGLWLQDYVFYPLLKSNAFKRLGKSITNKLGKEAGRRIPTYIGMIILWTLIGAWHGAGFNYIFGVGILQFIYIFIGEITMPLSNKVKQKLHIKESNIFWHIFQSLRCTVLMMFAWVFFNSKSFTDAICFLGRIPCSDFFGMRNMMAVFYNPDSSLTGSNDIIWLSFILCSIIVLLTVDFFREKGIAIRCGWMSMVYPVRMLLYLALIFALLIFGAYGNDYVASNFIYFEF